jgi:hypothetical protein
MSQKLLDALAEAKPEDLKEIQAKIEEKQKEIDALKAVQALLNIRINGKPARAAPGPKKKKGIDPTAPAGTNPGPLMERRRKVAIWLAANGPKSKTKIGETLGMATAGPNNINQVLDFPDWFHVSPDGMVRLTDAGEKVRPL